MEDKTSTTKIVLFGANNTCCLLTIVFVCLKLSGNIDWSWWWVLSPVWLSCVIVLAVLTTFVALVLLFMFIGAICVGVDTLISYKRPKDRNLF